MSREIRRVPANWQHPQNERGEYVPLEEGYAALSSSFMEMANQKGLQAALDEYEIAPERGHFMPDWAEHECTHFMMYETCSEGTPISPAFATVEELARWLADNGASSFADRTATYEQWLAMCRRGYAVSAVGTQEGWKSGVECSEDRVL